MKRELSIKDRYAIAGRSGCSHVTVARAYSGGAIRQASYDRICNAAGELELPKPRKVIADTRRKEDDADDN